MRTSWRPGPNTTRPMPTVPTFQPHYMQPRPMYPAYGAPPPTTTTITTTVTTGTGPPVQPANSANRPPVATMGPMTWMPVNAPGSRFIK